MKNKGFTLIELVAVILVLGIIALIALPTINNTIRESKYNSDKVSLQNTIHAIEDSCGVDKLNGTNVSRYYFLDEANVKTHNNATGAYYVDSDCNVAISVIYDDNKDVCFAKELNNDKIDGYDLDKDMTCLPTRTISTPASCFTYTETGSEVTITGYKCGGQITGVTGSSMEDVKITSNSEGTNMNIVIPAVINNKKVTKIADGAFAPVDFSTMAVDSTKKVIINSVVVPTSVKEIGSYAFALNKIKRVVLNEGLETIKNNAFSVNDIEGSIIIPNSVKTMGELVFYANTISNVVIGKNVETMDKGVFAIWNDTVHDRKSNINLTNVINKTGRSFDWNYVLGTPPEKTDTFDFETGKFIIDWDGQYYEVKVAKK